MQQLIYTVGCPGSGKSTWAINFLHEHNNDEIKWQRVCRDDLRMMCRSVEFSIDNEVFISEIESQIVRTALESGFNVIVDATHITMKSRNKWHRLAQDIGGIVVIEKYFDVSLEVCLERNSKRSRHVPEHIICDMCAKLSSIGKRKDDMIVYPQHIQETQKWDSNLKDMIIVDLDGTIADNSKRNKFDATNCEWDPPIPNVINLVKKLHSVSCGIIFLTARPEKYRISTMSWLLKHVCTQTDFDWKNCQLLMRSNNDNRVSQVVKKELFEQNIKGKYNIIVIFEDIPRVCRMWKRLGLLTFQLNDKEI